MRFCFRELTSAQPCSYAIEIGRNDCRTFATFPYLPLQFPGQLFLSPPIRLSTYVKCECWRWDTILVYAHYTIANPYPYHILKIWNWHQPVLLTAINFAHVNCFILWIGGRWWWKGKMSYAMCKGRRNCPGGLPGENLSGEICEVGSRRNHPELLQRSVTATSCSVFSLFKNPIQILLEWRPTFGVEDV